VHTLSTLKVLTTGMNRSGILDAHPRRNWPDNTAAAINKRPIKFIEAQGPHSQHLHTADLYLELASKLPVHLSASIHTQLKKDVQVT
jgi:hypothetical protein